eukprot:9433356-Lingulodinium_polyedra.AAC.1
MLGSSGLSGFPPYVHVQIVAARRRGVGVVYRLRDGSSFRSRSGRSATPCTTDASLLPSRRTCRQGVIAH